MKIVILDADPALGSASPHGEGALGAVPADALSKLGELKIFERTTAQQVVEHADGAEIVLTNKVCLGAKEFKALPKLKMVGVLATGVNVIDLKAAELAGVTVCNVPGYSTASTAQHAIALLLELCNHVGLHSAHAKNDGWANAKAFSYFHQPLREVEGLTLGIVGLGAIGSRVAKIAEALGMNVIVHTRTQRNNNYRHVDKEELLQQADVISLHCPLTAETEGFINKDALALMKKSALLLNVSRGPVINEADLAAALDQGIIAGAALDVLGQEPPEQSNALLSNPRCIITPHIAWASTEARQRLMQITAQNVEAYLQGSPQNVVKPAP